MRDLETCKAEILRRSENRIKERSRMRRRVLTLCVPLVLCLVIGAIAWPGFMRQGGDSLPPPGNSMPVPYAGEMDSVNMDDEMMLRIEDDAAAKLVRSLAPDAPATVGDPESPIPEPKASESVQEGQIYEFALVTEEGEETYTLSGGVLTCESRNWKRSLTEEEEIALRQALGLPEDDSR